MIKAENTSKLWTSLCRPLLPRGPPKWEIQNDAGVLLIGPRVVPAAVSTGGSTSRTNQSLSLQS